MFTFLLALSPSFFSLESLKFAEVVGDFSANLLVSVVVSVRIGCAVLCSVLRMSVC